MRTLCLACKTSFPKGTRFINLFGVRRSRVKIKIELGLEQRLGLELEQF